MCNDCLIVLLLKKSLKSELNLCLYRYMLLELLRISALKQDIVFVIVLIYECVCIWLWNCCNRLSDFIYRVSIHFPAKLDLSLYLVTLCNCHISHIVSYTHYTDVAALYHTDCYTLPWCNLFLYYRIWPVSHNDLSLDAHTCNNVSPLSVTVSCLILIHEVHINWIIWNLLIVLCM